ncbi:Sodium channel protein Nach [Papilio xuthus]|uniref:Sodium channel protein Nach n=1 Tax=Papilio xuthus TaxID=66420 RepID=A0A194Q7U6_PAPXU|nr:Sodium channel protein Nach [Papilio xuthus]
MALRNIFKQCFVEYTRNSSVGGLWQITNPKTPITQRIVWLMIFGLMCGIGAYFFWYLWYGSLSSPLIITIQSSMYPISNIEFPAIAICNTNIISKKALLELEWNKPTKLINQTRRQHYPGALYGLNLIIDPLIEDYSYMTRAVQGVETLIFDPTHYADPNSGRVSQRLAQPGHLMFLGLSSTKQIATPEVRKYSVETRGCLFHDERKKEYNDMYSYSACIFNCRIKTIHALCGCTPYAFPVVSEMPTCTLNDLQCLNKFKEKLLLLYPIGTKNAQGLDREFQDSLYCPECYPDCEFTRHDIKSSKINYHNKKMKHSKLFYKGYNTLKD